MNKNTENEKLYCSRLISISKGLGATSVSQPFIPFQFPRFLRSCSSTSTITFLTQWIFRKSRDSSSHFSILRFFKISCSNSQNRVCCYNYIFLYNIKIKLRCIFSCVCQCSSHIVARSSVFSSCVA